MAREQRTFICRVGLEGSFALAVATGGETCSRVSLWRKFCVLTPRNNVWVDRAVCVRKALQGRTLHPVPKPRGHTSPQLLHSTSSADASRLALDESRCIWPLTRASPCQAVPGNSRRASSHLRNESSCRTHTRMCVLSAMLSEVVRVLAVLANSECRRCAKMVLELLCPVSKECSCNSHCRVHGSIAEKWAAACSEL